MGDQESGAVRPDEHVGWRTPSGALPVALRAILYAAA